MTDDPDSDPRLALGPVEDRAAALAGASPRDRLSLRDHVVSADIGAFEVERGNPQRLRFNVVVELWPQPAAGDDVDAILSYDRIAEAINAALATERLALLETLAGRIAARILAAPQAARVFLRVEKLDRGPGALGVEIVRDAAATPPPDRDAAPQAPPPDFHLLAPGAALPEEAPGTLFLPALPDLPRPGAADPAAARRIALLALDQAAWALGSRHPGAAVAATRTEADWALRRGARVILAPARIVLDTPGAPDEVTGTALAAWLAASFGAARLVLPGDAARA